jgi:uncharacterized protein (TIGR02145 family)
MNRKNEIILTQMKKFISNLVIVFITMFIFTIFVSFNIHKKKDNKSMNIRKFISKKDINITFKPSENIATIKIGQQVWMAEDINSTVYNNGDPINEAKNKKKWKEYGDKKLGCYRKLSNGTYVYNGFAITDKRGIVPFGFAVPTYIQFNKLITFLGGGNSQSGKATKSLAAYSICIEQLVERRFKNGNIDVNNSGVENVEIKSNGESGFKAKKGGFVYYHGAIGNEGNCSFWWTSSSEGQNKIVVDIGNCSQDLGLGKEAFPPTYGFAVRAIKK